MSYASRTLNTFYRSQTIIIITMQPVCSPKKLLSRHFFKVHMIFILESLVFEYFFETYKSQVLQDFIFK